MWEDTSPSTPCIRYIESNLAVLRKYDAVIIISHDNFEQKFSWTEDIANTRYNIEDDFSYNCVLVQVSLGGVVGLFLGGSILSMIELIYHLTMGLLSQVSPWSNKVRESDVDPQRSKIRDQHKDPVSKVYTVWPLMDYYPNPRINLRECWSIRYSNESFSQSGAIGTKDYWRSIPTRHELIC